MKLCRCCGRTHTLVDVHRLFIGWQRYDDVSLALFNCTCDSTLAVEVPNPRIRFASEAPRARA